MTESTAKKTVAPTKSTAKKTVAPTETTKKKTVSERASGLSDEVRESAENGLQTAREAVRKFTDAVEDRYPRSLTRRCARKSSTPPWNWPARSARRSPSSCAASRTARASR